MGYVTLSLDLLHILFRVIADLCAYRQSADAQELEAQVQIIGDLILDDRYNGNFGFCLYG